MLNKSENGFAVQQLTHDGSAVFLTRALNMCVSLINQCNKDLCLPFKTLLVLTTFEDHQKQTNVLLWTRMQKLDLRKLKKA